ncbi:Sialomucin core protein [Trichinella pseudospiralis]
MEANDSPQTGTQLLPKRSKVNFASLTEEQKVRIQELNEGDPAYWQHWRLMKRFSISRRTLLRVLKHECQDEVKLSHNANNNKIQINNTADEGNLQPTWPVEITDQDGPFMTIYKEHKNFVHKLKSDL